MRQDDVLIKWTGSKRVQAPTILEHFPKQINTYYEPFLGGGSLLYALLSSNISVKRYRCSDINEPLIHLWKTIQKTPCRLFDFYCRWWPFNQDKYYQLRDQFNQDKDPKKFFCLLRSCRNGIVRFNQSQEFNSSFHPNREGICPSRLKPVLDDWHHKIQSVSFKVADYRKVQTKTGDFLYLDPPYASKSRFFFGQLELEPFWTWLGNQKVDWLLSLNGSKSGVDITIDVPRHLYEKHILINNYHGSQVTSEDCLYMHEEA